ncbi:magnesium-translocating P-type ATPase [Collimonas sp. OK242]|uniref:magnesium-translocating P-type ATPase n=1 Tax=Collimonas sp. OK242 TaxID=1798195 RepID=UPI0021009CFA|nr:magnesium-translocating P-type ATPase [Collimonas sp. OK242]
MPLFSSNGSHGTPSPAQSASDTLFQIAALDHDALLKHLQSSADGLLDGEARRRLAQYGPNLVAHEVRKGAFLRFLGLLASPLSLMLLALAVVNFFTGESWGALVIAVMVVLSSLLSFIQEYRSDKAAQSLRSLVATKVTVLRRDVPKQGLVPGSAPKPVPAHAPLRRDIALSQIVPGDIIFLSVGDIVPADVRILASKDFFVSQASLTGESLPVEKFSQAIPSHAGVATDLGNVALMGTNVLSGTATAVVAITGGQTCFGHVATDIAGQRALTSFDRGINKFIWLIMRFMLIMVPLVFLVNGFTKGNWLEALLFAVAVAVGLAPEMLPMIVTINLAKGALAMSRKKVIVKRLNAIQNFGAMDILCTDKTGTLTQDLVILEKHIDIFGNDSQKVTEYAYLNSYHQTGLKNLLDVAILKYVDIHEKIQADTEFTKVDEIPFDFQRRRMSVIVEKRDGSRILICKGAVEEILSVCTRADQAGQAISLEEHHGAALGKTVQDLNSDGFRVIAVAYRELPAGEIAFGVADEADLVLVGYIAFLDPPKDSAAEAIKALNKRGIAVKVLTGDNAAVTCNVGRHVGLAVDQILLGGQMDAMSDEELAVKAESTVIFAKLAPQQKARVIHLLQGRGHVVGYLGDGINDGPALKAADVGISVDSAVDIAKESADIILLKKSLITLKDGVLEGRKVFGNIIKYIKMSASSNFGNMLSVLGASSFLPFLPMAPVQILLNNLLYDFSQTTVATDHVDEEYMKQPRRWDIVSIGRFMLVLGPVSSLFDYLTFGILWYGFGAAQNPRMFQTGWFVESLLSQTLIVHVIRTAKIPFIQSRPSLPLLATTVSICMLGLWLPWSPLAGALGLTTMPHGYWLALLGILGGYLLATQLLKSWVIRRFGLN